MAGSRARILLLATALAAVVGCAALAPRPGPEEQALARAGQAFRAGDAAAAAGALEPWVTRTARAAREDLALRFLGQDYSGAMELARRAPLAASDDEARLWVARSAAALGSWEACLEQLARLRRPSQPWALCLRAEALSGLGDPAARQAFGAALSATAGTRLEALCAELAAEAAEAAGDDAAAEDCYKRAQKSDPSYTQVNLRLAALYRRHERWKDARQRLERARTVDPEAEGPRDALNALLAALPEQRLALRKDAAAKLKSFEERANPRVGPLAVLPGEPLVRIGLVTGASGFKIRLGGDMADAAGVTLPAGSAWSARPGGPGTVILRSLAKGGGPELTLPAPLRLRPLDPSSTFGLYDLDNGAGYFFSRAMDRYYRGLLEVRCSSDGMTVVDELGMEAYLCSVVPSEVLPSWPAAALRAQAVAARTESLGSLGRFRARGYDLCPTVLCAAYSGVGAEDPRTTQAVTFSAGTVMEDARGRLAPANYMDNSGGHTMGSSEAWPQPGEGSVGVADCPPGAAATLALFPVGPASLLHFIDDLDNDVQGWPMHEGHATWRWSLRLTPEELASGVDRRHKVGRLRSVQGLDRSAGGYLKRVRITGEEGDFVASSDRIRTALKGLKSNLFYVEQRLDAQGRTLALLFHGGGWGHGVGMSQSGARAMAEAGLGAEAILAHYFPTQKLHRRYPAGTP